MDDGKQRQGFWQGAFHDEAEGARTRNPFVEFGSGALYGTAAYLCVADLCKDPVSTSWPHAVIFGLASGVGAIIVRTRFQRPPKGSSTTKIQ